MLISNFNLNKPEWLELVFAKRNKEYGAYYIRAHYNENVNKAMIITFSAVALLSLASMAMRKKPEPILKVVEVTTEHPPVAPPKDPIHKAVIQPAKAAAPKPPISTTADLPPIITATPPPTEPPSQTVLETSNLGQETIKVDGGDGPPPVVAGTGGTGVNTKADEKDGTEIYNGVDIMPEPYGGIAAWAKFLQKNLRYPTEAAEKGISGKVFASFVIETNGTLSNITIVRGLGYGMDDEALRVLRKAPAWKPGQQNGHPVRVRYTLPLNFVLDNQ